MSNDKVQKILRTRRDIYSSAYKDTTISYSFSLEALSGHELSEYLKDDVDFFKKTSELIIKARQHKLSFVAVGIQTKTAGNLEHVRIGLLTQEELLFAFKKLGTLFGFTLIEIPTQVKPEDWAGKEWMIV